MLGILLLIIAAKEVDIVVILLSGGLGSTSGVDGQLLGAGAVGGVLLGSIAGQGTELGLVRGDVLVPAVGVGVLLGGGRLLEGLERLDISLRGRGAVSLSDHVQLNRERFYI